MIFRSDSIQGREHCAQKEARATHELPMYITTDCHRTPHRLHIRLLHQNLSGLNESKRYYEHALPWPGDASATGNKDTVVVLSGSPGIKETDLVTQFLDVVLRELLALAQLCNPSVYLLFHGV